MWDTLKDFLVPMITRMLVKAAAGGLVTLGIVVADDFWVQLSAIVSGTILAGLGAWMSKKNTTKALNTPAP